MKLRNLTMSSTKAFTFVRGSSAVTDLLQQGGDVRLDYLLIPPLTDPILVQIPGFTALVQNGSTSTVKWPVTGAYSKGNPLEGPYSVVSIDSNFVDKFDKLYNGEQVGGIYSENILPVYSSEAHAYYKTGDYKPETQEGLLLYDPFTGYLDDRSFVRTFGLHKDTLIRECPSFDLPDRIQLRITLVRVQEN